MKVYINPGIRKMRAYYGDILFNYPSGITIKQRLEGIAIKLWDAFVNQHEVVLNQINNYHRDFIGKSWTEIKMMGFSKRDAYDTVAMEYGFSNFDVVPDFPIDVAFEKKVDILLTGDLTKLESCIVKNPYIISKKSDYGHKAHLIHYLANNGVELYRQVVPLNSFEVLSLLLKHGVDLDTTMSVYGGNHSMIELFKTSVHPADAGIKKSFVEQYAKLVNDTI